MSGDGRSLEDQMAGVKFRLASLEDDMDVVKDLTETVKELNKILESMKHVVVFILLVAKVIAALTIIIGPAIWVVSYFKGIQGPRP